MSKYNPLWEYIKKNGGSLADKKGIVLLSYADIEKILGFGIDHSFLNFKKELISYGWTVGKISVKNETVQFLRAEK